MLAQRRPSIVAASPLSAVFTLISEEPAVRQRHAVDDVVADPPDLVRAGVVRGERADVAPVPIQLPSQSSVTKTPGLSGLTTIWRGSPSGLRALINSHCTYRFPVL